jgi:uncharacterized protein YbgA (DUF1722 family)/uncharacterized protein YbbK (DUF523 family)
MIESTTPQIKLGVSSCLLGEKVRYDSGHKKNSFIVGVLGAHFEFLPFCPEVSIGLGIPRETIHLIATDDQIRCVGTKTKDLDVTEQLLAVADEQKSWHQDLCGYVLKSGSPSCGMERVKIYNGSRPERKGVGLYARRLMENFPNLPVEEEGRLEDAHLRENFIQRVYIYSRWRSLLEETLTRRKLQKFHAQHKYIFMSHDQHLAKKLGVLLVGTAEQANTDLNELAQEYLSQMMMVLRVIATRQNHVNTLQHIQGYLKKDLDSDDKQELAESIDQYRQGLLPLIVPVTLLRHHFRRHPKGYIEESFYLRPHPSKLMLLNHV